MTLLASGLRVGDLGNHVDVLGARFAAQVDAAVAHHTIEPGRELRPPVLPPAAMSPDLEHRVLHDIFGVRRIVKNSQRDRVGAIDVTRDQKAERRFVARRQAIEQFLIFVEDDLIEHGRTVRDGRDRLLPGHGNTVRGHWILGGLDLGGSPDIKRVAHSQISNPQRRRCSSHTASDR